MAFRKIRPIRIEGNVAYVPLTKGYEAVIDVEDVSLVSDRCWWAMVGRLKSGEVRSVYAVHTPWSGSEHGVTYMHRLIAGTPAGLMTDHIDGDGLNNRRANLRPATDSQNQQNSRLRLVNKAKVKGVYWNVRAKKWRAQIGVDGRKHHLGFFDSVEDASAAYAAASAALHPTFGRTR